MANIVFIGSIERACLKRFHCYSDLMRVFLLLISLQFTPVTSKYPALIHYFCLVI